MTDKQLLSAGTNKVARNVAEKSSYDAMGAFGNAIRSLYAAVMLFGATPNMLSAINTAGDALGASPKDQPAAQISLQSSRPTNLFSIKKEPTLDA